MSVAHISSDVKKYFPTELCLWDNFFPILYPLGCIKVFRVFRPSFGYPLKVCCRVRISDRKEAYSLALTLPSSEAEEKRLRGEYFCLTPEIKSTSKWHLPTEHIIVAKKDLWNNTARKMGILIPGFSPGRQKARVLAGVWSQTIDRRNSWLAGSCCLAVWPRIDGCNPKAKNTGTQGLTAHCVRPPFSGVQTRHLSNHGALLPLHDESDHSFPSASCVHVTLATMTFHVLVCANHHADPPMFYLFVNVLAWVPDQAKWACTTSLQCSWAWIRTRYKSRKGK